MRLGTYLLHQSYTRRCHCSLPPLRPPSGVMAASPGVIPAQAGILTRGAIYKGHAVAVNYAGKSFFVFVCLEGFGVDQGDV